MPNLITRLKEEARKLLVVAVFFAVGFCIIIVHNRLLTEGSKIEIAPFARAIVGGLIAAKVLLTVDMLPFVRAFPEKPLAYNVVWKSTLYIAASVVFLYIEPFFKSLIKGTGLYAAHTRALHELTLPRTWATVIWVAVLMVVFVTIQELGQLLGKERMKYIFFGHRKKRTARTEFRKAA